MTTTRQHTALRNDTGSSALELALTVPLLFLLLAAAVDFGSGWRQSIAVSSAAEAGALYGLTHTTDTGGMAQAAVLDAALPGLEATATSGCECAGGSAAAVACGSKSACSGNAVAFVDVSTTAAYTPLFAIPGLPATYTLHGRARLRAIPGTGQ